MKKIKGVTYFPLIIISGGTRMKVNTPMEIPARIPFRVVKTRAK